MEKLVKVGKMPGRISEVVVDESATVSTVLEVAGLDPTGYEIKVDGEVATLNQPINGAGIVILAQKVKGN